MINLPEGIERNATDMWVHLNCNGVEVFINIVTDKNYNHSVVETMGDCPMDEYDVDGDRFWPFIFEELPMHHYDVMTKLVASDDPTFEALFNEELANYV